MDYFDDVFVSTIRDDPYVGAERICRDVAHGMTELKEWTDEEHELLLEAFALLMEMQNAKLIDVPSPNFVLVGDMQGDCTHVRAWISEIEKSIARRQQQSKVLGLHKRFAMGLGAAFAYEFSQGDLDRVQALIAELRVSIQTSDLFAEEHRLRLLRKLEKLQGELHKKMSDLDRFWGLVGEAGVVMGKFGKDAKPFFDRIGELTGIVWQAQKRAEELPSSMPIPRIAQSRADDSTFDGEQ